MSTSTGPRLVTEVPVDRARIPLATVVAAVGSTACNIGVWYGAVRYGRMTIGIAETATMSILGAVIGGLLFWLLARFTTQAVRWFVIAATIFIGAYGVGPVIAAYEPYMEGAELFTMTTVIATEIMHVVSGAWVIVALLRMTRPRTR